MLQKKLNLNLTLSNNFKPSFEYRTLTQGLFSRNAHQRPNHLSFDNHSTNKKIQLPNNHPTHTNLSLSHYNNHKSYSLNKTYTHNFLGANSNTIHTNINYNSYKKPPKKKNITINNVKNLFMFSLFSCFAFIILLISILISFKLLTFNHIKSYCHWMSFVINLF